MRAAEVHHVIRTLRVLDEGYLLAFSNKSNDELHLVWPASSEPRPIIRRIVFRKDEPNRTAETQLASVQEQYANTKSVRQALDQAFRVEPVSESFFKAYEKMFEETKAAVSESCPTAHTATVDDFVQLLFNRLMFVYFLSRKGWLTFNGDTDYLRAVWEHHSGHPMGSSFYKSRLKLLFRKGLNAKDRLGTAKKPALRAIIGEVPYLNGGLFEPLSGIQNTFDVPDKVISRILTDLFDSYNFTVTESTPYDVEVAIDPEMLGKVFEETVNSRKEHGAFYTPRAVVAFMCREALKGHIANAVPDLERDVIDKFVDALEIDGLSDQQKDMVATALQQVKVVDPACGSGAYLLGMMQELISTRNALKGGAQQGQTGSNDQYALRLDIIENNLHGADIDALAVNIAMLRLWLSLVVEYSGEVPPSLPNLDYRLVCGDSLAAAEPKRDMLLQQALAMAMNLERLKSRYLTATGKKKLDIQSQIARLQGETESMVGQSAPEGAVNWAIEFFDVFGRSGGFDIVVANPPYVRGDEMARTHDKGHLLAMYGAVVAPQSDLLCYFMARGIQLSRDGGVNVFVTSNSWLDVAYGESLKKFLLENAEIYAIWECAVEKQFSTAKVNTAIACFAKRPRPHVDHVVRFISLRKGFDESIKDPTLQRARTRYQRRLNRTKKWGGVLIRAPNAYFMLKELKGSELIHAGDVAEIKFGKKTGDDGFFVLERERAASLGIRPEFLTPVIHSPKHYRRLVVTPNDTTHSLFSCDISAPGLENTPELEYIRSGETKGIHIKPSCRTRKPWYNLAPILESKIAMMFRANDMFRTHRLMPSMACIANMYPIACPDKLVDRLCLSMNSSIAQLFFNVEGRSNFGGGVLELKVYEAKRSLIPDPCRMPDVEPKEFGDSVWNLFQPTDQQRALDDAVFDAIGLSQRERKAVINDLHEMVRNRLDKASN